MLSNGKKVAPSNLEGLLPADPCIDQALVCGEGRNFLTRLVVPHWDNVRAALAGEGVVLHGEPEVLARHPAVVDLLMRRVRAALADLSRMEQIKKLFVVPRPFSIENDELTVSLKVRRNFVMKRYAEQLEELYRDGAADVPEGEPEA